MKVLLLSQPCLKRHQVRVQDGKSAPKAPSEEHLALVLWNHQVELLTAADELHNSKPAQLSL